MTPLLGAPAWQKRICTLNRNMPAAGVANPPASRMKRTRRFVKSAPAGKPWLDVRKEKVARARRLVRDSNYPPPEVLDSVAGLLARHLKPGD